jgi:hypothetical protein
MGRPLSPPSRLVDYREALRVQHELVRRRAAGEIPDSVWYL